MGEYSYPGGQFYTMSWDVIALLARLHDENPIDDEAEDVLVDSLSYEAGEKWDHVNLPNEVAFDYQEVDLREEGKTFAGKNADLSKWKHAVGLESLNPHR